jgi:hypothetical protein
LIEVILGMQQSLAQILFCLWLFSLHFESFLFDFSNHPIVRLL